MTTDPTGTEGTAPAVADLGIRASGVLPAVLALIATYGSDLEKAALEGLIEGYAAAPSAPPAQPEQGDGPLGRIEALCRMADRTGNDSPRANTTVLVRDIRAALNAQPEQGDGLRAVRMLRTLATDLEANGQPEWAADARYIVDALAAQPDLPSRDDLARAIRRVPLEFAMTEAESLLVADAVLAKWGQR